MEPIDTMFNSDAIKQVLGVEGRGWQDCDWGVHSTLLGDWMNNFAPKVSDILNAGVETLVYSGDKDFICNWRGGEKWTHETKWDHKKDFQKAEYEDWVVDQAPAGQAKTFKNFRFLRVYDAGHMVPMNQPKVALSMLNELIHQ
jgi:cathepsin A (carboxypeptidase C)